MMRRISRNQPGKALENGLNLKENMSDYFSIPALSKSQLKDWDIRNPKRFWNKCTFNPFRKETELNEAMAQGQLIHAYLFESSKVKDMFDVRDDLGLKRSNKKWAEAQGATKKTIITTEENNHAVRMVEALLKHGQVRDLLLHAKAEAPYMWQDEEWGIDCKMKTDAETNSEEGIYCIDLKTTGKDFPEYIDNGNYQYEIGMYSRGLKHKYGKALKKFIYIFQSTKEDDEDNIRIKVVEGAQLEACEIDTDRTVKELIPFIKATQELTKGGANKEQIENIWLPSLTAESFEVSPWYDRKLAERVHKEII